jgi:phospholipid/cholesterol/gamma-HCH transport system substrate-binding protein
MTRSRHFSVVAATVGLFLAACFGIFLYWLSLSGTSVVPHATYHVRAVVPSAIALAPKADVRQAGVKIGTVTGSSARGNDAVLDLTIDPKYGPAYRDARVLIRGKSLLGENYVDLDPGSPRAGRVPDGGTLPISRSPESTQLDQILSTLDSKRRRDLQRILDVLGGGLGHHGRALNQFVGGTAHVLRSAATVNGVLAADDQQVAALVDDVGRVARALGARRAGIQLFAQQGPALARAVAARDQSLRQTLAALPSFLAQAHRTIGRLGRFSTTATPVMGNLRIATDQLAPAVADLQPAAQATRTTMRALGGFARRATPMVGRLQPFASETDRLMTPLEALLRQANPLLAYISPYMREVASFFSGMRAESKYYDALGHYNRVGAVLSKSLPVGLFTPKQDAALKALLKTGAVTRALETRGNNAYPKPGTMLHPTPFTGSYPRLHADPPYRRAR